MPVSPALGRQREGDHKFYLRVDKDKGGYISVVEPFLGCTVFYI